MPYKDCQQYIDQAKLRISAEKGNVGMKVARRSLSELHNKIIKLCKEGIATTEDVDNLRYSIQDFDISKREQEEKHE